MSEKDVPTAHSASLNPSTITLLLALGASGGGGVATIIKDGATPQDVRQIVSDEVSSVESGLRGVIREEIDGAMDKHRQYQEQILDAKLNAIIVRLEALEGRNQKK
jgi:hypothetical protein